MMYGEWQNDVVITSILAFELVQWYWKQIPVNKASVPNFCICRLPPIFFPFHVCQKWLTIANFLTW
jgi:hypothetical protein